MCIIGKSWLLLVRWFCFLSSNVTILQILRRTYNFLSKKNNIWEVLLFSVVCNHNSFAKPSSFYKFMLF